MAVQWTLPECRPLFRMTVHAKVIVAVVDRLQVYQFPISLGNMTFLDHRIRSKGLCTVGYIQSLHQARVRDFELDISRWNDIIFGLSTVVYDVCYQSSPASETQFLNFSQ
jgi:hypothetical protein